MGVDEGIDDTHQYKIWVTRSWSRIAPPWLNYNVPPNRGEEVVQEKTLIVVRERVRFILASGSTSLFLTLHVESLRRTHTIAENTNG